LRLHYVLGLALLAPTLARAEGTPSAYRLDEADPTAKPTYYSEHALHFLDHWPPPAIPNCHAEYSCVRAIRTPGHSSIVGMVKYFTVKAPLAAVLAVAENVEDYPHIWTDVLRVKVLSRDKNRTTTEWLRKAPAFFLPKIHYRMMSVVDRSSPNRVVSRSQLIDGNALKSSDSVAVYERVSATETRVSVVNFFDANFGPFRAIVEGKIWKTSMQNALRDDVAFRAHIEHPDWSAERLEEEAKRALEQHPIDQVEYTDLLKFE
jgi:uncharacterized membrane protein